MKRPMRIATGLLTLAAAFAEPNIEVRKPTREEIAAREYRPEPKPPMTKTQARGRAQTKAARKARSKQHRISKLRK